MNPRDRPLMSFIIRTLVYAVAVFILLLLAFAGENALHHANAPKSVTNVFGAGTGIIIVGIIAGWLGMVIRFFGLH